MFGPLSGMMGGGMMSQSTGDINYGTDLTPLELRAFLETGVGLQWHWGQFLASPYAYPTEYEYAGLSLRKAGGFTFGGKSPDSALAVVAFSTYGGGTGIVQLESLQTLRGPAGYAASWWHVRSPVYPEVLPGYMTSRHPFDTQTLPLDETPHWVGEHPGMAAKWRISMSATPLSSCWEHVPSEFSAFGCAAPFGILTPGLPPEMSLY